MSNSRAIDSTNLNELPGHRQCRTFYQYAAWHGFQPAGIGV